MADELVLQLLRESLTLVLTVAAPAVIAALVVGLVVGLFQAVTQLNDPALSLAARVVAVFGVLAVAGPWAFAQVARFAERVLDATAGGL